MNINRNGNLYYYEFDALSEMGVVNAFFTRRGGVSPHPWSSLNVGGSVGDDVQRVIENKRRAFHIVGRKIETSYDVWQVHGAEVLCVDNVRNPKKSFCKADAIITDRPELTLFMRFADCVPIVLYDYRNRVVCLVHAGWHGTVKKIAQVAVRNMIEKYGTDSKEIFAAIGPSIASHHYDIGSDVALKVKKAFGENASKLLKLKHGKIHLDLWEANTIILKETGVENVQISGICTACNLKDWYSHRAEGGMTGRFGVLIGLENN